MKLINSLPSNGIAKYSNCGRLLAVARKKALTIFLAEKISINLEFSVPEGIRDFGWSPDSQLIFCILHNSGTVEVFSLLRPEWMCRLKTGQEEIEQACWSPNSRDIVSVSKFNVRVRVWSLHGEQINFPSKYKYFDNSRLLLGTSGFAVWDSIKETINIFNTDTWEMKNEISGWNGSSAPVWSPSNNIFAIQQKSDYRTCSIHFYSGLTGKIIGEFQRERTKNFKGSKLLKFSHCGQLLAVGCYDSAIFVLDHILWSPLAKFKHTTIIDKKLECSVLKINQGVYTCVEKRPILFNKLSPGTENFFPGVKFLKFDRLSVKLVSVDESMPAVAWVWDIAILSLKLVIILKSRIKSLAWGGNGLLAILDSDGCVSLIDPEKNSGETIKGAKPGIKICWQPCCRANPQLLVIYDSECSIFV